MDDIRRPHQPQRRDYTTPSQRPPYTPPAQAPQPQSAPAPQPAYHPQPQAQHHQPQPTHHPVHHPPAHHQPSVPQSAAPPVHRKASKRRGLKFIVIILAPILAAGLFAAGYSLKSKSDSNTIPASITKQVNFSLYFPSPMPPGYIYMKDTATFQIGQVFYKFSNGNKRVTVNEQPIGPNKPDLSQLPGYTQFDSPIGQAALGSTFGQPTAVVITSSTIITMNTAGGVSPQDLKTAVQNLKNIGQNTDKKTNG